MFGSTGNRKMITLMLIMLISAFFLMGCMEAGAADWIGAMQPTEVPTEEPSTEEESKETVGEVSGGDREVENDLPSYDQEEPEDEEEDIFEEEENEEDEEEVSENTVSEDTVSENTAEEQDPDDGENHDVTKGSWDDDDWTAEATIGENYEIKVTVNSTRKAMQQEKVTSYSPAQRKSGKDINDLRFAFYRKVEGNKSDAADDVSDFEDVDEPTDRQLDSLMAVADDLGKLIAQFGITGYDFEHPAENDDEELTMDLYRKNSYQYYMYLVYDSKGHLEEINLELEEY